jgi:DNA polymerase III gamma/tau subunit
MALFDDYRPQTWADFIGNDKAARQLQAITARAKATGKPFALWISGPSGTGKSTACQIIARELGADSVMDVMELNGDKCAKTDVHTLETRLSLKAWGGGFRCITVDESHCMTTGAIQAWLTLLEGLPPKVAVMFTTTSATKGLFGVDEGPLLSRCIQVSLTNQGLAEAFAKRAQEIAEAEGLGGAEAKEYLALVRAHKNNMRAVLSQIEGFEMYRDTAPTPAAA